MFDKAFMNFTASLVPTYERNGSVFSPTKGGRHRAVLRPYYGSANSPAENPVPLIQSVFPYQYDRTWRGDDGVLYYGIDQEDGTTDWYNEDGDPEGTMDTPTEDEQDENDYRNDGYAGKCPYCRGTGYDPINGGQCDYCGGTGERS